MGWEREGRGRQGKGSKRLVTPFVSLRRQSTSLAKKAQPIHIPQHQHPKPSNTNKHPTKQVPIRLRVSVRPKFFRVFDDPADDHDHTPLSRLVRESISALINYLATGKVSASPTPPTRDDPLPWIEWEGKRRKGRLGGLVPPWRSGGGGGGKGVGRVIPSIHCAAR